MKFFYTNRLEIFTDGTVSFYFDFSKNLKQVFYYEKDLTSWQFSNKPIKNKMLQSFVYTSYKSRYKF